MGCRCWPGSSVWTLGDVVDVVDVYRSPRARKQVISIPDRPVHVLDVHHVYQRGVSVQGTERKVERKYRHPRGLARDLQDLRHAVVLLRKAFASSTTQQGDGFANRRQPLS
jgi:hypothetical protein